MTTRARHLDWYRRMLVIRYFEEKVNDLFLRGRITGTAHLCVGQEAVAVGACSALGARDYITSNHRGHGHFLARGADPRRVMAELFGKRTGCSGGRGGSQLMADFRLGFLGGNGITGGGMPLAAGVGLSIRQRRTRQVVLCFFGDGAAQQGTFHESLNMAGLWKLPVIFLCENNLYGMSTAFARAAAVPDIAGRAALYGMPGIAVDGNDLSAVRAAVAAAVRRARRGDGPSLIECRTYRLLGHSRGDPRCYRTPEEEKMWIRREPIRRFRAVLRRAGWLRPADDRRLRAEARLLVRDAIRFARRSPDPDPATLEKGVYA